MIYLTLYYEKAINVLLKFDFHNAWHFLFQFFYEINLKSYLTTYCDITKKKKKENS